MRGWIWMLLWACGPSTPSLEALKTAKSQVKPLQPWSEAETLLEGSLGKADKVQDQASTWVGREGDRCKALTVTHLGGKVGLVTLTRVDCPE